MARFGLLPLLAVIGLGVVLPWALHRLSRVIGAPVTVVAAVALGLAYGAIKADHAWAGDGLAENLRIMAVSAAVVGGYVGVSLAAARAVAHVFRRGA